MLRNKKNKIVVGIVGLGVGAFHLKNSLLNKNTFVKYICDTNETRLQFYKKKFNVPKATKNFNNIVNDKDVNLIIIASNDKDHFNQVSKSLKNNKHVFVEKPMCLTMKNLNKIQKIKKQKPNLYISSNLVLREHPFFKNLFKNKKNLKKIYFLEGDYNYGRLEKLTRGWRGKIKNYSVILGGGIHLLDLVLKLKKKKVKEIYTMSNKIITDKFKNTTDDFAVSLLKFEDNSIAKISSNFSSSTDHHHIFNIYSQKFSYFYKRDKSEQFFRENEKKNKKEIKYKFDNQMKGQILNNFIKAVSTKTKKLITPENELFYLMKICLLMVKSHKKNKIIKL